MTKRSISQNNNESINQSIHQSTWVHVFGWSESYQAKNLIETTNLEKGFTKEALPDIENTILTKYQIKDWTKFDYLTIEPPTWAYITQIIAMIITQGIIWTWAWFNEFNKKKTILEELKSAPNHAQAEDHDAT